MRNESTPKKNNSTGDRVYKTTFYSKIPLKDTDQFRYFPRGTRFDKIAYDSYGDSTLWWIITLANGVTNADIQVDPLREYRIPTDIESILADFKKINK